MVVWPRSGIRGGDPAQFIWLPSCLSFPSADDAPGSSAGASPGVAAAQVVCRSGLIPGVAPVQGPHFGHVKAQTPVFSSPDTSIPNMHLMTEARPSVESRCKWYSSWKYR